MSKIFNIKVVTMLLPLFFFVYNGYSQSGIVVNEFSNGDSGGREYMEFLIVGNPCTTVDIRGWIFDDNNGIDNITCEGFSSQDCGVGIAPGHVRFRNINRWSAVPVGSLILIYNDVDKNTSISLSDDPTDSNSDLVYVLPISDSGLEGTSSLPSSPNNCGNVSYTPGDCTYSPVSYSTPTNWSVISLNNTRDACQTRMPNGSYFHGFSYGVSYMTGGPDQINLNLNGTDRVFYLNCGHYSFVGDYSAGDGDFSDGSSDETPGYPNNLLNQELVDYYRGVNGCGVSSPCVIVLPIELMSFEGEHNYKSGLNELKWITASESDNDRFEIYSSIDGEFWEIIGVVNGAGNTTIQQSYRFNHKPKQNLTYYRLKQIDFNGNFEYSNIISISKKEDKILDIKYYDLLGKELPSEPTKGLFIKITQYEYRTEHMRIFK